MGNEPLEDLQAICTPCHEFLSGKTHSDPALLPKGSLRTNTGIDEKERMFCPQCMSDVVVYWKDGENHCTECGNRENGDIGLYAPQGTAELV